MAGVGHIPPCAYKVYNAKILPAPLLHHTKGETGVQAGEVRWLMNTAGQAESCLNSFRVHAHVPSQ